MLAALDALKGVEAVVTAERVYGEPSLLRSMLEWVGLLPRPHIELWKLRVSARFSEEVTTL